ncbi:hypothetical protein VTK26DRAFT_6042 [Humicola hyalothermophila]
MDRNTSGLGTAGGVQPTSGKRPYADFLEAQAWDSNQQLDPNTHPRKRPGGRSSSSDYHRERSSDGEEDGEPLRERAPLTEKNLAVFNSMAGKGKNHLPSSTSPDDSSELSSETTSTTTPGFAVQAQKNGILHPRQSKPPTNIDEIRERLSRARESASPPESEFRRYVNKVDGARNGASMVVEVSGKLLKEYDDPGYHRVFNHAFTAFPKAVGFNNGLSAPQPDFAEGLDMQEYRPFPIDEHIRGAVLYKDDPFSLALPQLVGEWKGAGKDMEEARLQSAYDGAALVYARNQALAYLGQPDAPGVAHVVSFTTDGTTLNVFAHYAAPSEDGLLEYHQYPVASTIVKNSCAEYKAGRRMLRNAQDSAREQSYDLRDRLKEHWKKQRSDGGDGAQLVANADPDTLGTYPNVRPCEPTPSASVDEPTQEGLGSSTLAPEQLPPLSRSNLAPSSAGAGQKREGGIAAGVPGGGGQAERQGRVLR